MDKWFKPRIHAGGVGFGIIRPSTVSLGIIICGILVHHGIFFNNGIFSNITGYIGIFMLDLWDIYPVIYPKRNPNVGKYTSTLGHLGWMYHEKSGVL
jgi:hypothetical protein